MAVTSDSTLAYLNPAPHVPVAPRKYSAPIGPYQSAVTNASHTYSYGSGSLLPMPPNYHEGSCWTLASLSSLNPSPLEVRSRKISVEVIKISLRMDGRWAQEKPYIIEKTWDEWLEVRERIVQRYPETESLLPKLSKTHGFLESIFANSKRSNNAQSLNVKELNNFLSRLVTKCSKKVINSSIVQNFFQTEEMRAGIYQVQYADDDVPPLRRAPPPTDAPARDEAASIASHLQAFRFPDSNAVKPYDPSGVNHKASNPNLPPCHQALGSEGEMPAFSEKLAPRYRGMRPTDPMAVINEGVTPPRPVQDPLISLGPILKGRTLGHPANLVSQKSRSHIRPNTAFTRTVPVEPPKRPNTSHSGPQPEVVPKHSVNINLNPFYSPVARPSSRRPSENLLSHPTESDTPKPSRPQLREFKSMQDIRATASSMKALGRSSRNGMVDFARNNSVPTMGEVPQISMPVRSPTNHWRRHRRTPSDSSSSFGSSQISPISSVLSSPTVTPSNSTHALLKSVSNQRNPSKVASRRSVDSLDPSSISRDGPIPSRLIPEPDIGRNFAYHTVPPQTYYPVQPHVLVPSRIMTRNSPPPPSKSLRRPHTSAENGKGVASNTLTLKVTHPESKTNIILAVQRGLCSLQQIKSKIQNKMKLAADVELNPDWKIKLIMVDQEEIFPRNEFGNWKNNEAMMDDGSRLVELVNSQSQEFLIKKITLRIF